jgi:glyoxylate reductase
MLIESCFVYHATGQGGASAILRPDCLTMTRVFISRAIPGRALEMLSAAGHEPVVWPGELPPPRDALVRELGLSDAAMTMVTDRIDDEMLAACPRLRILANMAVGYDNVPPDLAAKRGVWLTNTPGVLAETTADFAWSIMLSAARNVALSDRDTRAGGWKTWSPTAFLGVDLFRATLGVIGMGEIGEAFARRARGFDMTVLYASRTRKPELERQYGYEWSTLDDLLARSDFVSLHVPLNDETRHFMGNEQFARMKTGSILVNTARGQVVDQDALVTALRDGHLGGAALDVTDPEPLPLDHPLYSFPQVVITPHIASASLATRSRMAEMAAENIIAVLAGREPPNPVNRPESPPPAAKQA